jgi:hypothetical protein
MSMNLRDSLGCLTVPELKDLVGYLPGGATTARKDDLIERIVVTMLGPELKAIWSALDETQQAAVAEAAHHPLGEYSDRRFRARYQRAPAFHVAAAKSYGYSKGKRTALCLFIQYSPDEARYVVPTDLRPRLQAFVPLPAPPGIEASEALAENPRLIVRLTEREALQEAVIMLRTIEQARVQVSDKTALPGSATQRLLSDKLAGGDYYAAEEKRSEWDQEIGPIKAFAWPMLLQAGGLAIGVAGKLQLSPSGVKALSMPPAQVLRGLWQKWLKTTVLDEFSRVDAIKGQNAKGRVMTAAAPRRAAIEETLRACPIGRWIAVDEFSRFMRASDRVFAVTHDAWKLYLGERQYGSLGYDGSGGWNILQDRYILAFLFEYAATLGLVDVAYFHPAQARSDYGGLWGADDLSFLSRYDGLSAFRVTPLGAYLLGREAAYQPPAVASSVALSFSPGLYVEVVRGVLAAEETLLLDNWAIPVQAGTWQLDREKSLSAIEKGHDIAELKGFLERAGGLPLPAPVESFIRALRAQWQGTEDAGQRPVDRVPRPGNRRGDCRPPGNVLAVSARRAQDAGGSYQPAHQVPRKGSLAGLRDGRLKQSQRPARQGGNGRTPSPAASGRRPSLVILEKHPHVALDLPGDCHRRRGNRHLLPQELGRFHQIAAIGDCRRYLCDRLLLPGTHPEDAACRHCLRGLGRHRRGPDHAGRLPVLRPGTGCARAHRHSADRLGRGRHQPLFRRRQARRELGTEGWHFGRSDRRQEGDEGLGGDARLRRDFL